MNVLLNKIASLASADLTAAEVILRGIPNDDPADQFVPQIMQQIRDRTAIMARIDIDGQNYGLTVYRVDHFGPHYREFVSLATKLEKNTDVPLRLPIEKALEAVARDLGCMSMRMHTVRHGLVNEALNAGWHVAEVVLRKNLT